MSDRYREENDRILRSAIRRYAQEEIGGIPSADELKEIQFSEDYCARREAILRCGGRPEQAEGGLWYADDSITSRNDAILREAFAAYCEEDNRVPSGEALESVTFSQAYQKRKKQILRAKGRPVDPPGCAQQEDQAHPARGHRSGVDRRNRDEQRILQLEFKARFCRVRD